MDDLVPANSAPPIPSRDLQAVRDFVTNQHAPSTREAYSYDLRVFDRFCEGRAAGRRRLPRPYVSCRRAASSAQIPHRMLYSPLRSEVLVFAEVFVSPRELEPRRRSLAVLRSVLPQSAHIESVGNGIFINGTPFEVAWVGEGWLGDVAPIVGRESPPDIVVARRLSPGARQLLGPAGIGWADESGAAEIAKGLIVVSRTGHRPAPVARPPRWTPAVVAVAEALLCGMAGLESAIKSGLQIVA